jgi:hypothetical protein
MSVAFDKVQPGDVLLDVHKYVAGNTTMRVWGIWTVYVVSVDREARTAMCRWNGNTAKKYYESQFRSLRRHAPEWLSTGIMEAKKCHNCGARQSSGHNEDCDHPAAVRARKKVATIARKST